MKKVLILAALSLLVMMAFKTGKRWYLKPDAEKGQQAPGISYTLQDGTTFQLQSLRGKYVLVDFWGSWCKSCRREHPAMVDLYVTFQNASFIDAQGFEIVSVGIEQNAANWKKAILKDQLSWPYQVLETGYFEGPIVKAFGVKQLPTKFLLDAEGTMVAIDPTMAQVEKWLTLRLK